MVKYRQIIVSLHLFWHGRDSWFNDMMSLEGVFKAVAVARRILFSTTTVRGTLRAVAEVGQVELQRSEPGASPVTKFGFLEEARPLKPTIFHYIYTFTYQGSRREAVKISPFQKKEKESDSDSKLAGHSLRRICRRNKFERTCGIFFGHQCWFSYYFPIMVHATKSKAQISCLLLNPQWCLIS